MANVQSTTSASKSWTSFSRESALPQSSEQDQLDELRACFDILKNGDELLDIDDLPVLFQVLGRYVPDRTGAALLHRLGVAATGDHIDLTRFMQIAPEIIQAIEADSSEATESRIPRLITVKSFVPDNDVSSTSLPSETPGFDGEVIERNVSRTKYTVQNRGDANGMVQRRAIQKGPLMAKSAKSVNHTTAHAAKGVFHDIAGAESAGYEAGTSPIESPSETASLASESRLGAGPDEELDSLLALFADLSTDEMRLLHTATTLD